MTTADISARPLHKYVVCNACFHVFVISKTHFMSSRGISSVVRRCYHKVTGKPYAVKIIDKLSDAGGVDIEATTREEVLVLLALQGHENISKYSLLNGMKGKLLWEKV